MDERASQSERNKIIIKNTNYIEYFFSSFGYMKGGMEWIWLESNRFGLYVRRETSNSVVVVDDNNHTDQEANNIF